jgi:two-component system response regulator FixJ
MSQSGNISVGPPVVVVVDDDDAVCQSLKFALEVDGFAVHTYSGGTELLNDSDLASCACFIIDQRLLGMTGLELIAALRRRHIAAPAILITSHPTVMLQRRAAKAGIPIVEKPLLGNALFERVRDAIASSPPSL